MPFILAIEPDWRQATRVAALAPLLLDAEIAVVDTVDAALAVLASRVPDLVLTPLLLSTKDDATLTACLRDLDTGGFALQTLVTPVLASGSLQEPAREKVAGGLLTRLRRQKASSSAPDGCDPSVFAAQIGEYLARTAGERRDQEETRRKDRWTAPATVASAPMLGELLTVAVDDPREPAALPIDAIDTPDTLDTLDTLDTPSDLAAAWSPTVDAPIIELVDESPAQVAATLEEPPVVEARWEDLQPFLEDLEFEAARATDGDHAFDDEPSIVELPAADELWGALDERPDRAMAPIEGPTIGKRRPAPVAKTPKAPRSSAARASSDAPKKPRRPKAPARPMQDEWGLYDPEQCGFAALLERLQEMTDSTVVKKEGEERSDIMRR